MWQHNTIVSTWAKCLDELNIPRQVEPRNRYFHGSPTFLRHPTISCQTIRLRGRDATTKKDGKIWSTKIHRVHHTLYIPLVFEHFGFRGPMAEEYLNKISKKSKDEHGRNNEADFRDRWRKQLSVELYRLATLE